MKIVKKILEKFSNKSREKQHIDNVLLLKIENLLGYKFKDKDYLILALRHRSFVHTQNLKRIHSNERLELLGDSVLGLTIVEFLYRRYPNHTDGELAKLKSVLASGAVLSEVAGNISLGEYILMSENEAKLGGRVKNSIIADTYEAIIGALYLDGGLIPAKRFIHNTLTSEYKKLIKEFRSNYKSELQEYTQSITGNYPIYKVEKEIGPDHNKIFHIAVYVNGTFLGKGKGKNKKEAEQNAAKNALKKISSNQIKIQ